MRLQATVYADLIRAAAAAFEQGQQRAALTSVAIECWTARSVEGFLGHYHASGGYAGQAIELLARMATLPQASLARPAAQGLFGLLVERLSDSFDPRYCALYDRLFVDVVQFCRQLPQAAALDRALKRFGFGDARGLLARKAQLAAQRLWTTEERDRVRRVIVLSRVTLGADVAVTSVCLAKAKAAFGQAELVLVAPAVTGELFRGDQRLRVRPVTYDRAGGLVDRLNAWLPVLDAVQGEIAGLAPSEYVVIDPDSRLTQLGIFPVADDGRYLFFESRGYRAAGLERISDLTADWLVGRLGPGVYSPYVALSAQDESWGRQELEELRQRSGQPVVVANLGVGGNSRKRMDDAFERQLLRGMLASGATVLLAKGVGVEEVARAQRHLDWLAARGYRVGPLDGREGLDGVGWQGGLGRYAALIGAADLYVGYDSAGQHIAAAQGVPTVDIFVDDHYPMIARRWRPGGVGPVASIEAAQCDDPLRTALAAVRRLLAQTRGTTNTGGGS